MFTPTNTHTHTDTHARTHARTHTVQHSTHLSWPHAPRSIPANAFLYLPVYALHHSHEVWPHPEEFSPERLLSTGPRNPGAYMPFGGGARCVCVCVIVCVIVCV